MPQKPRMSVSEVLAVIEAASEPPISTESPSALADAYCRGWRNCVRSILTAINNAETEKTP